MFTSSRGTTSVRSKVSDAWPGVYNRIRPLGIHIACLGVIRGIYLFLLSRLRQTSQGKRILLSTRETREPLTIRLGTSDLEVYTDIYLQKEYEWDFRPSPKVIVDAGAYTGLSTSFFATRYPDATIIAIEPDNENFELLVLNTAQHPNVTTIHAALWSESGTVSLVDPGSGAWGLRILESDNSSLTAKGNESHDSRSIRAVTIADIIQDYDLPKIDLLKIDVEGSEKEIFDNSRPWIGAVDAICIELHDRFKAGCAPSFFKAVDDFSIELRRGEDVLVMRDQSQFRPQLEAAEG